MLQILILFIIFRAMCDPEIQIISRLCRVTVSFTSAILDNFVMAHIEEVLSLLTSTHEFREVGIGLLVLFFGALFSVLSCILQLLIRLFGKVDLIFNSLLN